MRACFSLVLFAKRAVKTTRLEKLRLFQLIVPFFVMYGFFAIFVCFLCFLRRLDELFVQSCAFGFVSQSHTRAAATSMKKVYHLYSVSAVESSEGVPPAEVSETRLKVTKVNSHFVA